MTITAITRAVTAKGMPDIAPSERSMSRRARRETMSEATGSANASAAMPANTQKKATPA